MEQVILDLMFVLMDSTLYLALALAPASLLFAFVCLFFVKGSLRLQTAIALGCFAGVLGLWLGGNGILGLLGLAWRSGVILIFAFLLFCSGVFALVCDVRCIRYLLRRRSVARSVATAAAALASLLVVAVVGWLGAFDVGLLAGIERVVTREGVQMVEVDQSWLDPYYAYYDYHGLLVRGSERRGWSETPAE